MPKPGSSKPKTVLDILNSNNQHNSIVHNNLNNSNLNQPDLNETNKLNDDFVSNKQSIIQVDISSKPNVTKTLRKYVKKVYSHAMRVSNRLRFQPNRLNVQNFDMKSYD